MERELAFKALVGSANYNLSTAESDKDYKVFVLPTFNDLYHGKLYTESKFNESFDEDYHDIRKLSSLFWKSNVNFVEVLFSTNITINESDLIKESLENIFAMKDEIAAMNLPYLYKACKGMYFSKAKYIEKGNEGTHYLVEKFGYDTKSAMHAFRIMDFIERFAESGFTDFKGAMQYDEKDRNSMLVIKNGEYTKDEYFTLVEEKMMTFEQLENVYNRQPVREDIKDALENILYQLVFNKICNERC